MRRHAEFTFGVQALQGLVEVRAQRQRCSIKSPASECPGTLPSGGKKIAGTDGTYSTRLDKRLSPEAAASKAMTRNKPHA